MHIIATGSYCREACDDLPPLKSLAREATGTAVRRIGRFVQLALIGAGRCVSGRTLPAETATYFTSGRGDLEVTLDVLVPMCGQGRPPAPFNFINTVGNSACFHVAKSFGLRGRSQFVTSRYAPLESALRLAALDLAHGGVRTALLGSADMCTVPLAEHRERIGVAAGTPVGEGSHWFLLSDGANLGATLGVVRCVRSFIDDDELLEHVRRREIDPGDAALAGGQHVPAERLERLSQATGIVREFAYRRGLPWYDSQTGHGIQQFLAAPSARTLVHVDGDTSGRSTLLVVDAATPRAADATRPLRDRRSGG